MFAKDYQRTRVSLILELETIDRSLKSVLNDNQLKNSGDVIELQIQRLKTLDALRFLRPLDKKDIIERRALLKSFSDWASHNIPEESHLVFHGTTLANTERILNSGRITSGKDRWTVYTSGDAVGEISVATKDFLEISMLHHMDLVETYKEYERFVPAGSLFVLKLNASEYQTAKEQLHIRNIYLKQNPNQLHAVITTNENQDRVKWWMQKNGFPVDKVYNFEGFKNKIETENLLLSMIKNSKKNKKMSLF